MISRRHWVQTAIVCITIGILMVSSGCGGVWNVQHTKLSESTYPKKSDTDPIQIFTGEVGKPHVEIAMISVKEAGAHAPSLKGKSPDAAMEQLRKRARELGADAVKRVSIFVAPTGTVGAGSVSVTGIAIRWQ